MGTGRIGGQTSLRTAIDAGVSFRVKKRDRQWLAEQRRDRKKLEAVQTLRGYRDMTPRLVKPHGDKR